MRNKPHRKVAKAEKEKAIQFTILNSLVCGQGGNQELTRGAGFIPQERRHCKSALGNFEAPSATNLPAD